MAYLPRVYDSILTRRLESKDAVLIEGAKWCGKTTTAQQQARSVLYMQRPETREQNIRLASLQPSLLLAGDTPRLIDEWQLAPTLWDAVRFEADKRQQFGQFILTGSATPVESGQRAHTGTGRIARMHMRPMSLFESGESTGQVSLGSLLAGEELVISACTDSLEEMAFLTSRGGWPRAVGVSQKAALQQAYDAGPSSETVRSYLEDLRRLFVIEELPSWNPNLRSKAAIRATPTRHFTDPSIAVAALGTGPEGLLSDLETFGLLFESLCIRDLRTYMDAHDGFVSHYRDSNGLECDAVVHLRDGRYGLIEVKLGGDRLIDEGAKSLIELRRTLDTSRMGNPAFLMVLTATGGFSYPREDGVYVVPIRALGV